MYSRYLGNPLAAVPQFGAPRRPPPPPELPPAGHGAPVRKKEQGIGGAISGLLKGININWDAGDILLALILLFLFIEGEDTETLIIMALVLFMGF